MVFEKMKTHEIKCEDEDGNTWKISMTPLLTKTNRFQLSFFFNEKEFELTKLQSNRSAEDMWDLLSRIKRQKPKKIGLFGDSLPLGSSGRLTPSVFLQKASGRSQPRR